MDWQSLGDGVEYGTTSTSWGDGGEVQIFAVREDAEIWNRYWDGRGWHPWEPMGGPFAGRPAAAARDADRIDLFGLGADGAVRHRWWNGSEWVPWQEVAGAPSPAAGVECAWSSGRLDLFVLGPGGELWYRALEG